MESDIDFIAIEHLNKMLGIQERPEVDSLLKADKTELIWCIRSMQKAIKDSYLLNNKFESIKREFVFPCKLKGMELCSIMDSVEGLKIEDESDMQIFIEKLLPAYWAIIIK